MLKELRKLNKEPTWSWETDNFREEQNAGLEIDVSTERKAGTIN